MSTSAAAVDELETSLGFKKQNYAQLNNMAMSDDTSADDAKTSEVVGYTLKELKGTWSFIIMFACL